MPMYNVGSYWRPIQAGTEDLRGKTRPFLCRLGVHRPHRKASAKSRMCLRCPYFWIVR
ncbi:hypothetical protein LCGC14_1754760 [marine sediment metagenome]|uniref:Uncharacterized protein n=1 Tax=marine sediment metagenome TaxID=412755 RepID=A0A0F9H2V4_9ZZZZ